MSVTSNATIWIAPGARVGAKLELVRPLAEGGMGTVWIARNLATGADVAVKVLRSDRRSESAAERFRHEAQVGATLAHRNVTRVFDLVEDAASLFLVMEVLRGQTLRDYHAAKKTLSNQEAVAIIVPVLSALQHAHDSEIIHRDVKPSNIFLYVEPDGVVTPKLFDFGIAKGADSTVHTRTGDALGTPSYMSPEQVRAGELDARSDLWAIGVVLYELITGAVPFSGPTPTAVLAQVLELEVDPDPKIEPRLWLEIQRALGKQAYVRHASAREMASALCAALGETEGSLAAYMARDPKEVAELWRPTARESTDGWNADASNAVEAALPAVALAPRVRSRFALLGFAGALLVLAGVVGWRSVPEESRSSPSPYLTAVPKQVSTGALEPPMRVDVTPPDASLGAHMPASSASTQRRSPRPAPAPPSRSLARTPGF